MESGRGCESWRSDRRKTDGENEKRGAARRFAESFLDLFLRTGSRCSICALHWISECRLGPMARRNADCRWRCVVFREGRLRPARCIRIERNRPCSGANRRARGRSRRRGMANFAAGSLAVSASMSVCPFSFLRQPAMYLASVRERGISPSLCAGERVHTYTRLSTM